MKGKKKKRPQVCSETVGLLAWEAGNNKQKWASYVKGLEAHLALSVLHW